MRARYGKRRQRPSDRTLTEGVNILRGGLRRRLAGPPLALALSGAGFMSVPETGRIVAFAGLRGEPDRAPEVLGPAWSETERRVAALQEV